jgi:hypothetical protein
MLRGLLVAGGIEAPIAVRAPRSRSRATSSTRASAARDGGHAAEPLGVGNGQRPSAGCALGARKLAGARLNCLGKQCMRPRAQHIGQQIGKRPWDTLQNALLLGRSTSVLDVVASRCIRGSMHRDRESRLNIMDRFIEGQIEGSAQSRVDTGQPPGKRADSNIQRLARAFGSKSAPLLLNVLIDPTLHHRRRLDSGCGRGLMPVTFPRRLKSQ